MSSDQASAPKDESHHVHGYERSGNQATILSKSEHLPLCRKWRSTATCYRPSNASVTTEVDHCVSTGRQTPLEDTSTPSLKPSSMASLESGRFPRKSVCGRRSSVRRLAIGIPQIAGGEARVERVEEGPVMEERAPAAALRVA